jgi:hypothetical protein
MLFYKYPHITEGTLLTHDSCGYVSFDCCVTNKSQVAMGLKYVILYGQNLNQRLAVK